MEKNKKVFHRQIIELFLESSKSHRTNTNLTAKLFCIQLLKKIGDVDLENATPVQTFVNTDCYGMYRAIILKVKLIDDDVHITFYGQGNLIEDTPANKYNIDYLQLLEFLLNFSIVNGIDIED